jgi:anaerobic ribonucleoside-triphosphate reductase activating protein
VRYAGLIKNDISGAPGIQLTFFAQGCPLRCPGCHNPETWDFNKGKEFTSDTMKEILEGLTANGIVRTLGIQGGESLCQENRFLTNLIINTVKEKYPNIKIYLWTGFIYEDLIKDSDPRIKNILNSINVLIDGPYKEEERDITLFMRGSRNQRVIHLHD